MRRFFCDLLLNRDIGFRRRKISHRRRNHSLFSWLGRLRLSHRLRQVAILRDRFSGENDGRVAGRRTVVRTGTCFVTRFDSRRRGRRFLLYRSGRFGSRFGFGVTFIGTATAASATTAPAPTASAFLRFTIFAIGRFAFFASRGLLLGGSGKIFVEGFGFFFGVRSNEGSLG